MDFVSLVHECAPWASPQTMASIVRRESGFSPFAIGINGGAKLERQPAFKEEAVSTANWLIARGYNIDMGLGQINVKNLRKLNLSVDDAFDACKNISAAARLLSWNYQSAKGKIADEQQALLAAISQYNTGNMTAGFSNGYVRGVVANANLPIPNGSVIPVGLSTTPRVPRSRAKGAQITDAAPYARPVNYANDNGATAQTDSYRLTYE